METNLRVTRFSVYKTKNADYVDFRDEEGNFSNSKYINFLCNVLWKVSDNNNIEDAIKVARKKKKETNFNNVYFYIIANDSKHPIVIAIY